MSDNYKGTIVALKGVRKHTNADRLNCVNIFGNNVIIGLENKDGDLGIFFPVESALSGEFIFENNLSGVPEMNKDGKTKGYFGKNGRVKAQKFREENSMGFWLPISSLGYLKIPEKLLVEGLELDEWKDKKICSKYVPATNPISTKVKSGKVYKKRESKVIPNQFRFHYDTSQLGKNIHRINPEDIISVSWKMHGTSAIAANVLCKKNLKWKDKIAKFFGVNVEDTEYAYLYSSRKVVKNEFEAYKNHYYNYDLWTEVGKFHFSDKLQEGESIYYEIVGYTKDGKAIQGDFDYGCTPGHFENIPSTGDMNKVYVYRITRTSPDGSCVDLEWGQLKKRCEELRVNYCPEIYYGIAGGLPTTQNPLSFGYDWRISFFETLQQKYVYDQNSKFCNNPVPEEGIVLRKEGLYLEAFKLKSFRFLEYESKQLDKEVIDIETEQSVENE